MNENFYKLLPNPFAVDYIGTDEPIDLYTEKEMLEFATRIVQECARICDIADEENHATYEELLTAREDNACLATAIGAAYQAKLLSKDLKNYFEVE